MSGLNISPGTVPLPLSDLRILDLTSVIFGPYTTQMLGDFGADVIKVEPPAGDLTRHLGPARNPGMSSLFLGCNRNKRSLVLDLKRAPAKKALWRLIEGADLIVHNIRPQKIAALGFEPDTVLSRNRNIVYGSLHGYWEEGPYGGRPAFDDVIQGESGIAGTFVARGGDPVLMPTIVADKTAALLASTGLMAALLHRFRTGRGVYLETSMFEGWWATLCWNTSTAPFSIPGKGKWDTHGPCLQRAGPIRLPMVLSVCWLTPTSSGSVSGRLQVNPQGSKIHASIHWQVARTISTPSMDWRGKSCGSAPPGSGWRY